MSLLARSAIPDKEFFMFSEMLLGQFQDGVLITTACPEEPKIIFVNQSLLTLSGYEKHELLGKSPELFEGAKTKYSLKNDIASKLIQGETFKGLTVGYNRFGLPYHVELQVYSVGDAEISGQCFVWLAKDLSNLKAGLNKILRKYQSSADILFDESANEQDFSSSLFGDNELFDGNANESNNCDVSLDVISNGNNSNDSNSGNDDLLWGDPDVSRFSSLTYETSTISAQQFHDSFDIDLDDITQLHATIADCFANIELAQFDLNRQKNMQQFLRDLAEFANTVFYLGEFTEMSNVLNIALNELLKGDCDLEQEFIVQTLFGLTQELNNWVTDVFVTRTAKDIHALERSIVGSTKQLLMIIQ